MKTRIFSLLLALCLLLALIPQTSLTAQAATVSYPVEGGNIYFDSATGTITGASNSVTSIQIPEKIYGTAVTAIADWAFSGCSQLTSVTIADSVTTIGEGAFNICYNLTNVKLPSSLTRIEDSLFIYCSALSKVTIPDNVTSIGGSAFLECGLTSISIPASVTSIETYAFCNCGSLKEVTFEGNAPSVEKNAFCLQSYDSGEAVTKIPGLTLYYVEGKSGWTSPTWNGYPTVAIKNPGESDTGFSDVKPQHWFYSYVLQASAQGLVNGFGDNTFCPFDPLTRAQAVTLLYRAAGAPAVTGKATFSDLDGQWYQDAICWAQQNKVVNGISATEFAPNTPITREAFLTMIWRAAGSPTSGASLSGFADTAKVSDWAVTAFAWAVENGIINGTTLPGKTGLHLAPQNIINRAEAAKILVVYTEL